MDYQTVGLIANASKEGAPRLARAVKGALDRARLNTLTDAATASMLGLPEGLSLPDLFQKSDLIIVLGGDGTLLQAVNEVVFPAPPLLAVNLGTLGFLTGAGPADFDLVLEEVLEGRARFSERTLLAVEVVREGAVFWKGKALNDVVVSRGERSRLIRLEVEIDGESLTEYNADGLIIATPTGSTAYSLSAGGPVLAPDSGVFVITPICPHVLTNRSLIVNDRSQIGIHPSVGQGGVCLTVDGREPLPLGENDFLRIGTCADRVKLVFPQKISFYEVLRQKLKWSGKVV
jgi:NAD+ kinase